MNTFIRKSRILHENRDDAKFCEYVNSIADGCTCPTHGAVVDPLIFGWPDGGVRSACPECCNTGPGGVGSAIYERWLGEALDAPWKDGNQ